MSKHEGKTYMKAKHTSIQKSHVFADPMYIFSENGSQGDPIIIQKIQKQPPELLYKKAVLKYFSIFIGKDLCWSLFFNKVAGLQVRNFIKQTLTQVFSCEYCEILKNTYFEEHLRMAVSDYNRFFPLPHKLFLPKKSGIHFSY